MQAIRKITVIENQSLCFDELKAFEGQSVEVIVLPIHIKRTRHRALSKKTAFFRFQGQIKSSFVDTSEQVDKLIYG